MTDQRSAGNDHGLALIAVLVVMGGALLVATSLLFVANAEIAGSSVAAERVQAQALVRSGIMAVMGRLNEQRETILAGRTPELDESYEIYETGSRIGLVRLLPVGPGGELLVPEAGKRDLQVIDAEMLAATGLVDEELAARIVDYRQRTLRRPYQSVGELLGVPGMTFETLYGPVDRIGRGVARGDRSDDGVRGLCDAVTVYGFEPALQVSGKLRINLNVPWSDELGSRVAERFGSVSSDTLKRIMDGGTVFDTEAKLFGVLNFFQMDPSDWPEIIDTFTSEEGELHYGRLDINTAPYEALLTLPGIGPEQAADIVRIRDDLSDEDRETVAWPAIQGIVAPEAYDQLGGLITTRSWTYRLRLAAGEVDADDPQDSEADGAMSGAIIYEVVLDLSSPRPRIAYLREVSWLRTAALIAANVGTLESDEPESDPLDEPDRSSAAEAQIDVAADPFSGDPVFSEQPGAAEAVPPDETGADMPAPAGEIGNRPATPVRKRIGRWTAG